MNKYEEEMIWIWVWNDKKRWKKKYKEIERKKERKSENVWEREADREGKDFDWLAEFYGLPTLVGYLMPNPIYIYVLSFGKE